MKKADSNIYIYLLLTKSSYEKRLEVYLEKEKVLKTINPTSFAYAVLSKQIERCTVEIFTLDVCLKELDTLLEVDYK